MAKTATPFLHWVGGKTQILPALLSRAPARFGTYWEPFVGGGALFFALRPRVAVLADANWDVINAYHHVREEPEELMRGIDLVLERHAEDPVGTYHAVRRNFALDRVDKLTARTRAAGFIYLNKTGFNGLWRVNGSGAPNMSIGTNGHKPHPVVYDHENILRCAEALQGAYLAHGDYTETCAPDPGDFVYADPPYVPAQVGGHTSYTPGGWSAEDHRRLPSVLAGWAAAGAHVMVSNSAAATDLYTGWASVDAVSARRSIAGDGTKRGPVGEIIVRSWAIAVPSAAATAAA